jgi:putative protease
MQREVHSESNSPSFVPEILAPVGGREQFFAALNSGADAVFLGLKNFNARARAENFTLDDLRELVPLAHSHGMNVLVTMNILIKNSELKSLVETLAALEDIGVHAIIVQDLGLARLCKQFFPNLRLHASTQMAVHNLDGVLEAMRSGFKRVVLARELTALEIKKIRAAVPREQVELEAFCHGSLCYSYSGLCFFSGAEDARSGNRGECAYTCRKPYKIVNEPGHGFLFSMKDLNTVESLHLLVDAGIDTLKIEGRKKDAQYVSTVVQTYRQRLDDIYGRATLRRDAPALAHAITESNTNSPEKLRENLSLTFQRESSSFFLKGRYHENVIDLNNPTHKGQPVGSVVNVRGRLVEVETRCELERYDGLRIDPAEAIYHSTPQHGATSSSTAEGVSKKYENNVCHFSLRQMFLSGKMVTSAPAGSLVAIEIPDNLPLPAVGDNVVRTRSDALRRNVEKLSRPSTDARLRPLKQIDLEIAVDAQNEFLSLNVSVLKFGIPLLKVTQTLNAMRPKHDTSTLVNDLRESLGILGNIGFASSKINIAGDTHWFVPRGQLKELKRNLEASLPGAFDTFLSERLNVALETVAPRQQARETTLSSSSSLTIKVDRLEYLDWIIEAQAEASSQSQLSIKEVLFEPKRAFLPDSSFASTLEKLKEFRNKTGITIRLAIPTVLRAWDEPVMKRWVQLFVESGVTSLEIGNLGVLSMLERWGLREKITSISSDFTLYSLNTAAVAHWRDRGIERVALSVEDDFKNVSALLAAWPEHALPEAILFKDTPLFIAESCSLTALHNGCPGNTVCGYRTLEIENDAGERFFVAHESCKSVVYDKRAYSITHRRAELENLGIRNFRLDFLTRPYEKERFVSILKDTFENRAITETHTANFDRTLL